MSPSELLTEGWSLMAFGMGFVFLFLSALVCVTILMSKTIGRFFPEPVGSGAASGARGHRAANRVKKSEDSTEIVAAISAAIRMHRLKTVMNDNNKR